MREIGNTSYKIELLLSFSCLGEGGWGDKAQFIDFSIKEIFGLAKAVFF